MVDDQGLMIERLRMVMGDGWLRVMVTVLVGDGCNNHQQQLLLSLSSYYYWLVMVNDDFKKPGQYLLLMITILIGNG